MWDIAGVTRIGRNNWGSWADMWDTTGVTRIGRNNWGGSWAYTDSCKMLFWFRIRGILCRLLYFTLQFFAE